MKIYSFLNLLYITLIFNSFIVCAAQNNGSEVTVLKLELAMYQEHQEPLERILALGGGTCLPIEDLMQPSLTFIRENSVILDFLTLCHALKLGGINPKFSFVYYPNAARALIEMKKGNIMMSAFTLWAKGADSPLLYSSTPVVSKGKFEKIFYTTAAKKELFSGMSFKQIKQLYVVSNPLWENDWNLLTCLGFKLETTLSYKQMYPMVNSHKADLLLSLIATNHDNYHRNLYGVELVPLPGLKLKFNDELKFYISNIFPQAKEVLIAINKGLKELESNGTLKLIHYYQGMYTEYTKDWKVLECNN